MLLLKIPLNQVVGEASDNKLADHQIKVLKGLEFFFYLFHILMLANLFNQKIVSIFAPRFLKG